MEIILGRGMIILLTSSMLEGLETDLFRIATEELTMTARLEHLNFTVADPLAFAELLCRLFDWKIRWQGSAIHDGRTVHVGSAESYVAIYGGRPGVKLIEMNDRYSTRSGLNHIGVVVDDLDQVEALVKAEGFTPHSHANYEPGKRFYFAGPEGVEIEVVSYG
jgi:catechol 2,3-dioxygenase-like lactoylglutathione lyase family enzyme